MRKVYRIVLYVAFVLLITYLGSLMMPRLERMARDYKNSLNFKRTTRKKFQHLYKQDDLNYMVDDEYYEI